MDFNDVIAKLKDNKLVIPAVVVGGGIGVFLLFNKRGNNDSIILPENTNPDDTVVPPSAGDTPVSGGSDNGSIIEYINQAIQGVVDLVNQNATGTNQAIENLVDSVNDQLSSFGNATPIQELGGLETLFSDFLNAFGAYSTPSISSNVPVEYVIPPDMQARMNDNAPIKAPAAMNVKSAGTVSKSNPVTRVTKRFSSTAKSAGNITKSTTIVRTPIKSYRTTVYKPPMRKGSVAPKPAINKTVPTPSIITKTGSKVAKKK